MFKRTCPNCERELNYTNLKNRNTAEKNKVMCRECTSLYKKIETLKKNRKFEKRVFNEVQVEYIISKINNPKEIRRFVDEINNQKREILKETRSTKEWIKKCPNCNVEIEFSTKFLRDNSVRNGHLCCKCVGSIRSEKMKGENNPFFNKHHTEESKKKIKKSQDDSEKYKKFLNKIRSDENRRILSNRVSGDKNPRYKSGSLYSIWLKKYGQEEADRRNREYKEKLSLLNKGENNNMYGKPSPKGSGNGWSGWYNNWFFRSIHELSYMINVIEKENLKWESAENKNLKIKYTDLDGSERNYFADFLIEDFMIVEIKPERLKKTKSVVLKSNAAKEFCKKNNYVYEIITPKIVSNEQLKALYLDKKIVFTERYEKKFKEKFII